MPHLLPLARFNVLATTSPDAALDSIRQRQPGARNLRAVWGPGWHLSTNAFQLGAVTLVASRSGGYTIELVPDQHVRICLPLRGDLTLEARSAEMDGLGRSEGFITAYSSGRMIFQPKSAVVLVTAECAPTAEAMRLLDCEMDPSVLADRFAGVSSAALIGPFRRTVMHALREIDDTPVPVTRLKRFRNAKGEVLLLNMAALLAGTVRTVEERRAPHSRVLRRACDYIESAAPDEFSFADLAAHAGTSLRTVQLAFRRELGTTVSAHVRQRRLAAARALLLQAPPSHSVSSVAEQLGFYHLGRFSAEYRRAFGERPSDTVRRRR